MEESQIIDSVRACEDSQSRALAIQAAYEDLRKIAARKMANERLNHTLTKTALVNEISLKMLGDDRVPTSNPDKFLAYASTAMRHFLIDHARTRGRQRRGGNRQQLPLNEAITASNDRRDDLLALNDALDALGEVDPRRAKIVEMIYFGGMTKIEVAQALDISLATVKRDWIVARAWLSHELRHAPPTPLRDAPVRTAKAAAPPR